MRGEPDVGKSALVLRAADRLQADGVSILSLSLRDLPMTALEVESQLGGALGDVLSGMATGVSRLLILDGSEAVLEGKAPLFTEVALAARSAGLGLVAVTRLEPASAVISRQSCATPTPSLNARRGPIFAPTSVFPISTTVGCTCLHTCS